MALQGPSHQAVPSLLLALVVLAAQWVQLGQGDQPVLESLEMFRKEISWKSGHCEVRKASATLKAEERNSVVQRGRNAAVQELSGRSDKPEWTLLLLFLQSYKEKAQPHAQDPPQKVSRMSWDVLGRATLSPHWPLPRHEQLWAGSGCALLGSSRHT